MTGVNSQYRTFVANMRRITGLGAVEVGVAPDQSHLASGGYHCGPDDIRRIGRWSTDYSTRQARDKIGGNDASAFDVGDDWPRGGRAAWLRWNNLFLRQLQAADPALASVRAINFSPDGTARRRYDTFNRAQGVISSTDSVYMHTHGETWRDQAGTPALDRAFRRIEQMADVAIRNIALPAEGGYSVSDSQLIANGERGITALVAGTDPIVFDYPWNDQAKAGFRNPLVAIRLELAAQRSVIEQLVAAFNTGSGGSLDAATILAGVDTKLARIAAELKAETRDAVADLGEGGAAQVRADQPDAAAPHA